jgi:hypothetical protein
MRQRFQRERCRRLCAILLFPHGHQPLRHGRRCSWLSLFHTSTQSHAFTIHRTQDTVHQSAQPLTEAPPRQRHQFVHRGPCRYTVHEQYLIRPQPQEHLQLRRQRPGLLQKAGQQNIQQGRTPQHTEAQFGKQGRITNAKLCRLNSARQHHRQRSTVIRMLEELMQKFQSRFAHISGRLFLRHFFSFFDAGVTIRHTFPLAPF